ERLGGSTRVYRLTELSKLESFKGSIHADTEENKATMEVQDFFRIDDPSLNPTTSVSFTIRRLSVLYLHGCKINASTVARSCTLDVHF
ncbi:hypothetical protein BGZ95_002948, partial [Linnemannia exigua]